ncbi:hypothetical protein BJ165DRAFT_1608114 [Panaeolus papilionaceus]|nr:hypothetical protein BJ165DRAFT_1608114 [Panaeolus papilionaceus]
MPPRSPSREVQLRALGYGEKVGGDVSVIVLLGPSGAGKSNFIETLGSITTKWPKVVDLAKARVDDGTQEVYGYRMEHQNLNIYTTKPIVLVDTPGLSNPRMSEMQVQLQIKKWMKKSGVKSIDRLFYMDSISEHGMSPRKRKSLEIFKVFCGLEAASRTVAVTTMWDLMWNPRLKADADHRFKLLKERYWNDFLDQGSRIVTFNNTFEAALENLKALGPPLQLIGPAFAFEKDVSMQEPEMGRKAFQVLTERCENLDVSLQVVEQDIKQSEGLQNAELNRLLLKQKTGITHYLKEVTEELKAYSPEYKLFRDQIHKQLDRPGSPDSTTTNATNAAPGPRGFKAKLELWSKMMDLKKGKVKAQTTPTAYDPPVNLPNIPMCILSQVQGGGHRQQAMVRQSLDKQSWDATFSGASHISSIGMKNILPEDVVILLLGATGSGRSAFLSALDVNNTVWVGDMIGSTGDQASKTMQVQVVRIPIPKAGFGLVIIDTPGFNSGERSESETLRIIADALADKAGHEVRFNGVVYFQKIDDNSLKTVHLAIKICGEKNYYRIAFVTTHWDLFEGSEKDRTEAISREKQLKESEEWSKVLASGDSSKRDQRLKTINLSVPLSRGSREAVKQLLWDALLCQPHVRLKLQLQVQLGNGTEAKNTLAGLEASMQDVHK